MKKKRVKNTNKITKRKVKTVEIKRISTGVENLDKLSGGGFIEKSITLVAGSAGSGKKKKFFYLEYSPEQVKSLIEEGGGTVDQLILKYNIKRLVIDSITSYYLLYQDEGSRKAAGLALFELINQWGCTAVLTSQAVTSKDDLMTSSLEFEADSIILLYHFRS